jgi:hypothetical protein
MGKTSSRFKVAFEDYYISKRIAGDATLEENLRYYEELEKEKIKILLLGQFLSLYVCIHIYVYMYA